jgi:hypothetical protein
VCEKILCKSETFVVAHKSYYWNFLELFHSSKKKKMIHLSVWDRINDRSLFESSVNEDTRISDLYRLVVGEEEVVLLWKGRVLGPEEKVSDLVQQQGEKLNLSACVMKEEEEDKEIVDVKRKLSVKKEELDKLRQRIHQQRTQPQRNPVVNDPPRQRRRIFVFRFNLDFNVIMKIAIFAVLLTSEPELAFIAACAFALYVISYLWNLMKRRNQVQAGQQMPNQQAAPRRYRSILPANESGSFGFIVTLERFIYGLFASLYPNWQPDEVPEARPVERVEEVRNDPVNAAQNQEIRNDEVVQEGNDDPQENQILNQ